MENPETKERLPVRRIEVRLQSPTRDGDTVLGLFSNLPETVLAIEMFLILGRRNPRGQAVYQQRI